MLRDEQSRLNRRRRRYVHHISYTKSNIVRIYTLELNLKKRHLRCHVAQDWTGLGSGGGGGGGAVACVLCVLLLPRGRVIRQAGRAAIGGSSGGGGGASGGTSGAGAGTFGLLRKDDVNLTVSFQNEALRTILG